MIRCLIGLLILSTIVVSAQTFDFGTSGNPNVIENPVALDIGNDDILESQALKVIAIQNDTNNICIEDPAFPNELLCDFTLDYPKADLADSLLNNPVDCPDGRFAHTINAQGNLTCSYVRARVEATDCTAVTNGNNGEICFEQDANTVYLCEPTAGLCDTVGEWTLISGGGGATALNDLTDVFNSSPADRHVIIYDGVTDNRYENRLLAASDISDQNAGTNITADLEEEGVTCTDCIDAVNLNDTDAPADEECLTYEVTGDTFEWQPCGGGSSNWTDTGAFLEPNTDGDGIRISDAGGTKGIEISHDGTQAVFNVVGTTPLYRFPDLVNCDTIDTDANGNLSCGTDASGSGGTANILDLGDDATNESTDLIEIATTGDTNNIFTEPTADKLLIAVGNDWPKADNADDVTCTGCVADGELATDFISETELDTEAELETQITDMANIIQASEIDTSAEIAAIATDETGSGALVFGTSPTLATPAITGKIDRNNVSVDDDDCTGEQGLYWYDTTDSAFEFCNANSGVPTVLGGGGGGDNISIDSVAVVDPDFQSGGHIDFVNTSNVVTANINNDAILESHLKAVDAAVDEECLTYESTTGDFEWQTCGGGVSIPILADKELNSADDLIVLKDTSSNQGLRIECAASNCARTRIAHQFNDTLLTGYMELANNIVVLGNETTPYFQADTFDFITQQDFGHCWSNSNADTSAEEACLYYNSTDTIVASTTNGITLDLSLQAQYFEGKTTAGITASATQTQGQQALTSQNNEVSTVAAANNVVTMPVAIAGRRIVIINNGANTLQIFPASGDNLGAGLNTSVTLASGSNVEYVAYNATNWEQL